MTCFLIGSVIGSFFAVNLSAGNQAYLTAYLKTPVSFGRGVWFGSYMTADLLLLIATFLSACLRAGALISPITFTAKGFLISFVITLFVKVFGFSGYFAVFALSFVNAFLSTACLLVLSLQAFQLSLQRRGTLQTKRRFLPIDHVFCLTAVICAAITVLASTIQFYTAPMIGRLFC